MEELFKEKIEGCVIGAVISEYMGAITDSMSKQEIDDTFAGELDFPPTKKEISCGFYCTRQMLSVLETLTETQQFIIDECMENSAEIDLDASDNISPEHLLAQKIHKIYYKNYDPSVSKSLANANIVNLVYESDYLRDPVGTAARFNGHYNGSKAITSPSEPLTRAIFTGSQILKIACVNYSEMFCRLTQNDKRCVAACVMISEIINFMIYAVDLKFYVTTEIQSDSAIPKKSFRISGHQLILDAIDKCSVLAYKFIEEEEHRNEFKRYCYSGLEGIKINDIDEPHHIFKPMACALWSLRELWRECQYSAPEIEIEKLVEAGVSIEHIPVLYFRNFFSIVTRDIAMQGGGAIMNTFVTGAVLGAALGINCIPPTWVKSAESHASAVAESNIDSIVKMYVNGMFDAIK